MSTTNLQKELQCLLCYYFSGVQTQHELPLTIVFPIVIAANCATKLLRNFHF